MDSREFFQPKLLGTSNEHEHQTKNKDKTHNTMVIQAISRLGETTINPSYPPFHWCIIMKKPHACTMHAKTSNENIHATRYLQRNSIVVVDIDVLLCLHGFISLLSPYPMYSTLLQECSEKNLSFQEYEREKRMTTISEQTKVYVLIVKIIFITEAYIFFIFLYFSFKFLYAWNL